MMIDQQKSSQLSIGIITYNRINYLPQAIASALAQNTKAQYNIIIVDDCSNDGTKEYLAQLQHPKIKVHLRQQNGGESASRNDIVSLLNSEWVMWLDDDDILLPHAVESQLKCLEQNPDADIIYANLQICDESLKPRPEYLKYVQIAPELLLYRLLIDNMLANGGTLIRRKVFQKVGLYDLSIKRSMDYDFWARAALNKCTFVHNDDFIYFYRAHSGNYINPREQDPEHHIQYSKVAAKIIQNAPIEEILPMLTWKENPSQAAAQSLAICALVFLKWTQFDLAEDAINQSEELQKSQEAIAIRGLLYNLMGKHQKASENLCKAILLGSQSNLLALMKMSCLNVHEDFKALFNKKTFDTSH